jgi:glycosyltransferase involved in cell wall biosynthesis
MRILLLGEYSRLHNSLKEGLTALGHEVILVGNGDGFKNYPVDFSIKAKWCETKLLNIPRQIIKRFFKFDVAQWEQGIRFYFLLPKLKGFDVVQLINESPIQTSKSLELFLLKKVVHQNGKLFLLSAGVDYLNVKYLMENRAMKSLLQPYFENPNLKKEYHYVLDYLSAGNQKIHNFVYQNCAGIIASDMDYVLPLKGNPKFLGLIPNPVNCADLPYIELPNDNRIVIFLGINQWNYNQKGIGYFEKALDIIKEKYNNKIEILIARNIPYQDYISLYNKAHILLDQVYAYDQGYNALEAMAKGKVVFTGAEKEFTDYYKLTETVAINAKPDVNYLVERLSFLIENPQEMTAIGKRARTFIEKEHNHVKVAKKYLTSWEQY